MDSHAPGILPIHWESVLDVTVICVFDYRSVGVDSLAPRILPIHLESVLDVTVTDMRCHVTRSHNSVW